MYKVAHSTSRVAKDGSLTSPYAPRPHKARLNSDYPGAQRKNMQCGREYFSLTDPNLTHYYRRKLLLSLEGRPKPRVTTSSLSFRSQSSFSGRTSTASTCHTPLSHFSYKVVVKTGANDNAGTSARAYISLQGSKGTLKRRRLQKRGAASADFTFKPGTSELFRIRGKDVGEVTHVTIESGGLKKEDSWYVESVVVTDERGVKWVCPFRQWLSLYHTDCQLSRTAKARQARQDGAIATEATPLVYMVEVLTGDVRGGGTEANVFLTLHGARQSSSKKQLEGDFTRGSTVRSEVTCPGDLGPITMVTIGHDNSGFGADWFLDQVILYRQDQDQEKTYFLCRQWLSRTQGDGLIERTLTGSATPPVCHAPLVSYLVTTDTGSMRGAGTSANVYLTLHGMEGTSGERRLDNHPDNFDRGRRDTFLVRCSDLGSLKKVRVRHDNTGPGASWYLEEVAVKVSGGQGNQKELVKFPCGHWLERCDGCGGEVEIDLYPSTGEKMPDKEVRRQQCEYRVTTVTGDMPGAGTSANAYVVLCARDGTHSGKLTLDNGGRSLCAGQKDSFSVLESDRLSSLDSVMVGHDNAGHSPGWRLNEMWVECVASGDCWYFPCHQWLSRDLGDKQIQRELHPATPTTPSSWDIRIVTSDLRGAGTDADVMLQLHGNERTSAPVHLGDNVANFEQGEEDVFRGVEIGGSEKLGGKLEMVTLSHDGTGPYPDWHVDSVHLTDVHTAQEYLCRSNCWLSKENGNSVKLAAVELPRQPPYSPHSQQSSPHSLTPGQPIPVPPGPQQPPETPALAEHSPATPYRGALSMPHITTTSTPASAEVKGQPGVSVVPLLNGAEVSVIREQDSSITNKYLQQLRNNQTTPTFSSQIESDSSYLAPPTSFPTAKTIPYTVHVMAGPHPTGDHTPYLRLVLCGHKGQTPPICLEQLGSRPLTGSSETYSVESLELGPLHGVRLRLVGGASDSRWHINKITIHSPTTGHTYHFLCGRDIASGEECVLEVMDVLGSSVNTSTGTGRSSPRVPPTQLTAYEVKLVTADKKGAGTSNSVYLVLLGQDGSSKTFYFKNSSRSPKFQRGQTDTFQVATPSPALPAHLKVAHCPRRRKDREEISQWYLFHVLLICLPTKTKFYFSCRKWVGPSPSSENLNFTELALSKTEH